MNSKNIYEYNNNNKNNPTVYYKHMMRSISPAMSRRSPELVSGYIHMPDNIESFEFDTCFIDECFVLKNIAGYFFKTILTELRLDIDEVCLTKFIGYVCEHYNPNHFHNFQHAVNILQMTYLLLKHSRIMPKLEPHIVVGALIAALAHDVDHPGNTNSYEINSMSKWARLYNDISVLENHHCALTFELMDHTGLNKCLSGQIYRDVRRTIIACILGTDMSKHVDCLANFSALPLTNETLTLEEQITIVSSFVHFADLSSSLKPFDICFEWSRRISLEFNEQTIKEELEGLPSHSFMKIRDNLTMCLNEISFITKISLPTWSSFVRQFSHMSFLIDKVENNITLWKTFEVKYNASNDINKLDY